MDERERMDFFHEVFDASLPRLGPGDDASTLKALKMAGGVGRDARVLDLGCGNGHQTMVLARNIEANILAIDIHKPFLDELGRRAAALGLSDRIEARQGDMCALDLAASSFDLIWCEGAIFVMGFEQGLEKCFELLAPGGVLALTELCWFRDGAPEECLAFFGEHCPLMAGVEENLRMIADAGFEVIGSFPLPESAWTESYLRPIGRRIAGLRQKNAAEPEKLEMLEGHQKEIDIYERCSDYYGYEFFVMRK